MSQKEKIELDLIIIGAGIVGLATAYEISKRFPTLQMALLDQAPYPGEHSSGRNSGVLHAGIYYPTGSLKHRLCLEGNRLWDQYAQDLKIDIKRCGKFIVACQENELSDLDQLLQNAQRNEVPHIREATSQEVQELKTFTHTKRALFSPRTGIINTSEALKKLSDELFKRDIPVLFNTKVEALFPAEKGSGYRLETANEIIETPKLINAAGLGAIDLRQKLGLKNLKNYFVKGHYFKTTQKLPCSSLIYPIPPKAENVLGVHSTFDLDGIVRFGPDHLALSDETLDYSVNPERLSPMLPGIRATFNHIDETLLTPDYAGIRSKIKLTSAVEETLHHDFWIKGPEDHGLPGYIELCGIDSPGFTSAPAIARYVCSLL